MPSEIQGLVDLSAYLKYGNHVAHFSIPFVQLEDKHPDFIRRLRTTPSSLSRDPVEPEADSAASIEQTTGDDFGMQVV